VPHQRRFESHERIAINCRTVAVSRKIDETDGRTNECLAVGLKRHSVGMPTLPFLCTFETCRRNLRTSVYRGQPEVAGRPSRRRECALFGPRAMSVSRDAHQTGHQLKPHRAPVPARCSRSLALQRVDKGPGDYFRGRQRRPIINSQNEPQGSVGSPATEWSMPPATNGCVGPHHPT